MAIKKKGPTIKRGTNYSYNPATFIEEHKMPNSYATDRAQDVLDMIKPYEFMGRKFLFLDTEDHPLDVKNHEIPKQLVRRWVGTGKKAIPVDIPFCMSVCDGVNMITLYDSVDNGYKELKKLSVLLDDPTIEKVYHNTKFDMHMLANIGMRMIGKLHDTVVLAKLTDENRMSFQLKDLARKLPQGVDKFEYMVDAYKKNAKVSDYRHIPRELMTEYANADVWNCFQLFIHEYPRLVAEELEPLYDNEMELMVALWAMERYGMLIDPEKEDPLKQELQKLTDETEKAVYDTVGYVFNMNSNPQIHKALLHLGADPTIFKYTDKGNVKLDKKEFERLENLGIDLVVKIGEYRKAEKLLNTYAVGIYDQRDRDYRVHGSINQTEATTGRMSITKPALQTLPKKDKRIRGIFVPTEEFALWFFDLDQVEYRGLAHYAKAQGLIETIKNGVDVHLGTAQLIHGGNLEDITDSMRDEGKTLNFSLVYGQGDAATAASLKKPLHEARMMKQQYFDALPEVQPFLRSVHSVIQIRGFVKNFYGRRRRLERDFAYKAPNALIQGWAADYIKHKLLRMYKYTIAYQLKSRLVNIVHDEVVAEIHKDEQYIAPKLRTLLSDTTTFRVPITAGADYSEENWGAKVERTDIGFAEITPEEEAAIAAVDVFDGSVFSINR